MLSPKGGAANAPDVLWIHGGGYISGIKEMVYMYMEKSFRMETVPPQRCEKRGVHPTPLLPDRRITPISHRHMPLWATENLFIRRHLRLLITCKKSDVFAEVDVYPTDMHAFDMMDPESEPSRQAAKKFNEKIDWENLK